MHFPEMCMRSLLSDTGQFGHFNGCIDTIWVFDQGP